MEIKFIYGTKKNEFAAAIMAAAQNSGKVLRINHPFVSFEVDVWTDFLHIVWTACEECSRDSRGQEIVKRLPISLTYKGKKYCTEIWYCPDTKGLYYASVD